MLITGHRGASGQFPENTLLAFKEALKQGATAIELDVRRCKSGEMVVIHDATTNRTTGDGGKVAEMTLTELQRLDAGMHEPIPTLDQVLETIAGKAAIFIEMKGPGAKEVAHSIHRAVNELGFTYAQLPVISFKHSQLLALKLKNPHIQTGLSFGGKHPRLEQRTMIPLAKTFGASAVNPNHSLVTKELVDDAHQAGLAVNTWTVNQPEIMKRMIEAGVDALMSDYPHRVVQVLEEKQHEQGTRASRHS